jgi:hypothetical protein
MCCAGSASFEARFDSIGKDESESQVALILYEEHQTIHNGPYDIWSWPFHMLDLDGSLQFRIVFDAKSKHVIDKAKERPQIPIM